jgi:hypothetical protein
MKFLIQIILLVITSLILVSSVSFDDTLGQIYSILVAFYRLRENFAIEYIMYLAIITLLVLGSIATGLFGRKIGVTGLQWIISNLVFIMLLTIIVYLEVYLNSIPISILTWIESESLNIFGDSNLVLLGSSISAAVASSTKKDLNISDYCLKRFINKTMNLEPYRAYYRFMSHLPPYLDQVLIGILLSDASIERPSKTGLARLSVILGEHSLPYLLHLCALFEPFIDTSFSFQDVTNKTITKKYSTVRFKTVMAPIFVYYHKMFYIWDENSQRYVKIIPKNIDSLITPVVLAHLIMGDGNLKKGESIIRIYTNSFTRLEVEMLASTITSRLGIETKAVHDRNGQYMLSIKKSQIEKVRLLLSPYMHPSMAYKLGISGIEFCYEKIKDQI